MQIAQAQIVYLLDVVFLKGDTAEKGEIVIDSGAADNVMPYEILDKVDLSDKDPGVSFTGANGTPMEYYGKKRVNFVPLEHWEAEFGTPFQGQA